MAYPVESKGDPARSSFKSFVVNVGFRSLGLRWELTPSLCARASARDQWSAHTLPHDIWRRKASK